VIVGCYVLDLYCEKEDCPENHRGGLYEPVQFTEHSRARAVRDARRAGWTINVNAGTAYCRNHNRRATPATKGKAKR
jgi:hypothetical protein